MNILQLIKEDHDEAMRMIEDLEKKTEKDTKATWNLTQTLVEEVLLHAKTEEKVLYSSMREKNEDFRDFTLEGDIEHKLLESTLKRLLKIKPGKDGRFKATLTVVKELLKHHGKEEEEKEYFPKIRKAYKTAELVEMGEEFKTMKEKLRPSIETKIRRPPMKSPMSIETNTTVH
jgi:hemerythrin superfamily protein